MMAFAGWAFSPAEWALRVVPPLLLGLLFFVKQLRDWEPPESLHWLFAWRVVAPAITMSFVFLFEFVLADNVLFIIWPQAAFVEWIDVKLLGGGA